MPSLRETLDTFARAIFSGEDADAQAFLMGGNLAPRERLAIYRNNVLVNYQKSLRDSYPALVRLVGEDFFNGAARCYARDVPSTSGDLQDYGETFPAFLEAFEPARQLPYLPDVARLEWAMHRVFHAADQPALAPPDFSGLSEAQMPGLRLTLHPAVRLLKSDYPIGRIWQISQPGHPAEDAAVNLDEGGQCLLIIRRDHQVFLEPLSPAEHAMLVALSGQDSLEQALDTALAADTAFDLGSFLARHVLGGTFSSINEKEVSCQS